LTVPEGTRTEKGLRHNLRVGVQYIESWLRGTGCVPIYNLMEDVATAEICRSQVWQWIRHHARLDDGTEITLARVHSLIDEELAPLVAAGSEGRHWQEARALFERLCVQDRFEEFLTLPAYDLMLSLSPQ
jgi:malate synthase